MDGRLPEFSMTTGCLEIMYPLRSSRKDMYSQTTEEYGVVRLSQHWSGFAP